MSRTPPRRLVLVAVVAALGAGAALAYVVAAPLPGQSLRTNVNCLRAERDRARLTALATDLSERAGIRPMPPVRTTGCTAEAEIRLTMEIGEDEVADVRSALVDEGCLHQGFSCRIPGDPAVSAAVQPASPQIGVDRGKLILWLSADPRRRSAPAPGR